MTAPAPPSGPLAGIKVVEFAGIGPGPLCGMLLADMGAQVLLLERKEPANVGIPRARKFDLSHRGKASLALDLKRAPDVALARSLVNVADVVIEGFRPGTMERLGLGPQQFAAANPGLIYGRLTGFGQSGPLAEVAGHDLNYIALTGGLNAIGRHGQPPTPPLNLLGDYAGGSMLLAQGILAALVERGRSGKGQTIDAAMVDGASLLLTPYYGLVAAGLWSSARGDNILDSGAPFYDIYTCADGRQIAFAAIEHKFRKQFAAISGFPETLLLAGDDKANWPALRKALTALFLQRDRDEWCRLLESEDTCISPVLTAGEAAGHAHMRERQTFIELGGVTQPAPAPRFSRSACARPRMPPGAGEGGRELALRWGLPAEVIDSAVVSGPEAAAR